MNFVLFVPALAFVVNGLLLIYIALRRNRTLVHSSFLLLTAFTETWVFIAFLLKAQFRNIPNEWLLQILRFDLIFWLSPGFLILNFVYELINRKKDNIYFFCLASLISSLIIGLSSPWVVKNYQYYTWGITNLNGPLFIPVAIVVVLFPIIYSLYLIDNERRNTDSSNRRSQLALMFWGTTVSTAIGSLTALVLPELFGTGIVMQIPAESSVIFMLCSFWAIIKYGFMTIGIENIADDLFLHIQNGVMIIDEDNVIVQLNQSALSMLERDESDLLFQRIDSIFPDCPNLGDDFTNHELKVNLNGQNKTFYASLVSVGQKMKCIGKILILHDITDRKAVEEALREREERLHRVVNCAYDGINIVEFDLATLKRRLVMCNDSYVRMSGYSREELMAADDLNLLGTDHYFSDDAAHLGDWTLEEIQEKKPVFRGVSSWNRPDGEENLYEWTSVPWVLGDRLYLVGIDRDITERKKIEKDLRASEERYKRLVENCPDAIMVFSKDKVIYANAAAAKLYGSETPLELQDRTSSQLIHDDDLKKVRESFEMMESLDTLGLTHFEQSLIETKMIRFDGETVFAEIAPMPIQYQGRPAVLIVARDMSQRKYAEKALAEMNQRYKTNEEKYRMLFNCSPDAIFLLEVRSDGETWPIVDCNEAACKMNGYAQEVLIGKPTDILLPREQSLRERQEYYQRLLRDRSVTKQATHRKKDGSIFFVETSGYLINISGKEMVLEIDRDITERIRSEQALHDNEERYRTLFSWSPDGIFLFEPKEDDEWIIIDCNEAACKMNGYLREELIGQSINLVNQEKLGLEEYQELLARLREEKRIYQELLHRRKDGTVFPIETITNLLVINSKEVVLGIDRDISERKKAEETIHHQMYYDLLTGLPNRTLFSDRLTLALAQSHRAGSVLAVMFLNLDRFKTINDTLGHAVGDCLLTDVSERISACLGEGDTLARLSGDTFTLLLSQVERVEDVAKMGQTIMESFKQPFILSDMEIFTTLSIGIALYPNDGEDADNLMKNADTALNRAKEQGRNNYQFYTPIMNAKASERLALESSLRRALSREEFIVYYQPQINAETRRIVGVEALVRWRHPDLGLVSPAEFIPMAEETGLIVPIGAWVLRSACLQWHEWQKRSLPAFRIAVNLSARQFQQKDLVEMVRETLAQTGFDPQYLELEITESIAMQNADYTTAVLNHFKAMGVHISLDDFGTGYSSLNYLKRFPIDTLKIDQSFVRDLTLNQNDFAIAKAVIALAHSLNLKVMAEGVETEEQMEILIKEQCDTMQGYLFGRPIPANAIEDLFHRGD